jgi:hypothetical protein
MACIWYAYGMHMACIWYAYGMHMVCIWYAYGMHMVCIWRPALPALAIVFHRAAHASRLAARQRLRLTLENSAWALLVRVSQSGGAVSMATVIGYTYQ